MEMGGTGRAARLMGMTVGRLAQGSIGADDDGLLSQREPEAGASMRPGRFGSEAIVATDRGIATMRTERDKER